MRESFENFHSQCKKSIHYDPWVKDRGVRGYIEEMKKETREVVEAIEKNDVENIKEELGDVFLDWLHASLLCEDKYGFTLKDIIDNVNEKLERRKPYIMTGEKVSKERAEEIWQEVKKWEKQ
ncbi:MAG: MazG nucleotide pyrophosphohydrolase domain-containing protein [Nanobdellota archaeon]